jgi:hypothetical protein
LPRILQKTVILVTATAIAILLAEALARIIGLPPEYGRLFSMNGFQTRTVDGVQLWSDTHPRYDSEDIRRVSADRRAFKIIGLGDSIMYGVQEPKEKTYLEQARQILATRSSRPVEVLNLATPGFNTAQENAVHREIDAQIKANLVLVHWWADDVRQYRSVGGYVVDVGDISEDGHLVVRALPLPPRLSDFLLIHSRLYELLTHFAVAHQRNAAASDWISVAKPLGEIQERVRRSGGRLLVLASAELNGPSPKPPIGIEPLRRTAAVLGIEVIELSDWLKDVQTKDVALDECHFNEAGHRLIGEHLAEYLLQHDLEDSALGPAPVPSS